MKRWGWAALVAVTCWTGCGEGGSLPRQSQEQPATTNPDGTVNLPGEPVDPDAQEPFTSLWPLTRGSTWTYRITDPKKGVFEKRVEVLGEQAVPETSMKATAVRSIQPHQEELSWQIIDVNGLVVRLREEDREENTLQKVTTWNPATVKSIAREQPVGWSYTSDIREVEKHFDDGEVKDQDKTYIWSVEAVNETVTTPAGTFTNAIQVKRKRGDKQGDERTYWLVPGIGKVKETGERLEELVSHDVKKP
ncbi:hypothetical protein JRI60_16800 [Archangium violaceum]|uniref:hypothetical protein n=1 Tax=Archangium violaceum TaxID=83451 RepID=UPI00194DDABC|nr:hypothetical protein [Archangium violaceum]QRO00571.1 hypothetical protein JRI60_16800 [Archangium violaceum]